MTELDKKINEGGAAFPVPADGMQYLGMSIRDYFAAKAMQSMVSVEYGGTCAFEILAKDAYEMADAMIKVGSGG